MQDSFQSFLSHNSIKLQPVVPFNAATDKVVAADLSVSNPLLTAEVFSDIQRFTLFMDAYRKSNGARYAIGGYAEHRQVYSFSNVFDADNTADEPRRLHLGIDIWGEALTPVMCPLDGRVHSSAFNSAKGDYGGTVIVEHTISGLSFYTLYGHLEKKSVQCNEKGKPVLAGEEFARTGLPGENGYWPPHLHFQLILDMEGRDGDYPGVCKYSEKERWLANCPDGDVLLGLGRYLPPSG